VSWSLPLFLLLCANAAPRRRGHGQLMQIFHILCKNTIKQGRCTSGTGIIFSQKRLKERITSEMGILYYKTHKDIRKSFTLFRSKFLLS
jgi:hypothetical protein